MGLSDSLSECAHSLSNFLAISQLIALLLFPCAFGVLFASNFAASFPCLTANCNQFFMLMEFGASLPSCPLILSVSSELIS